MLLPNEQKLLSLLLTCEDANVALAKELAQSQGVDLQGFLEREGFSELGLGSPDDFWNPDYLDGVFVNRGVTNLRALQYFPNLTEINLYDNQLEGWHGAGFYPDVSWLCVSVNPIGTLAGLVQFPNLTHFFCSLSSLNTLKGIESLPNLVELDCSHNPLANLQGLENAHNLEILNAAYNELTNIDAIMLLPNLQTVDLSGNPDLPKKTLKAFQKKHPHCELIL